MHILFTCGREAHYVRNEVILRALRRRYQVTEITDNRPGSLIGRSLGLVPRLLHALRGQPYDLIFVGFYGYLLAPWLGRLAQAPLIFDAFVSNYDTLCFDRQRFRPQSLMGKIAFRLDRTASTAADRVLLDTVAHKKYFAETFRLNPEKLEHLYVSCNEDMFHPLSLPPEGNRFQVLYYSSYMPLHGVETIINSAKLLAGRPDIQFRLIGQGPTYPANRKLAQALNLANIEFIPPVPYTQLPREIAQADLCLAGPFGDTAKARRVIPGKLFQFLAMARPTIAADTPANRELLTHGQSAFLIPPADQDALAAAILQIKEDEPLRQGLAGQGLACYQVQASERVTGQRLYEIIEKL